MDDMQDFIVFLGIVGVIVSGWMILPEMIFAASFIVILIVLFVGFVWMCYADTKRPGYDPHGGNPLT